MVTGTNYFMGGVIANNSLHENVSADGQPYSVPIVKLTGDSQVFLNEANNAIPEGWDDIQLIYTGTNISEAIYKKGGEILSSLTITYNTSGSIIRVQRV